MDGAHGYRARRHGHLSEELGHIGQKPFECRRSNRGPNEPLDDDSLFGVKSVQIGIGLPFFKQQLDVIVTTHKTIDLVFHTQVYKLKRDMTRKNAVSASSVAFMHNEGMEVIDET